MRRAGTLLLVLLLAGALAAAWTGSGYHRYLVGLIGLTTAVGVGLNVLLGLTGEVSLGQVGFFAIGAYAVGILTTATPVGFWLALAVAALAGAVVGALLALPALRVRGPYLAMITSLFGSAYTQILMFSVVILALAVMPDGLFQRRRAVKV